MFSTEFDYKDNTYTATVIISGHDGEKFIGIEVPEALHNIVPEGKIVISAETGKLENGVSKDPVLVKNILAAVEKHEEVEVPRGLWN